VWAVFWLLPADNCYAHSDEGRQYKVLFPFFADHVSTAFVLDALAARYSRAENVYVVAVVIPELKLGNVQRHVFGTETFNRVRVDSASLARRPSVVSKRTFLERSPSFFSRWPRGFCQLLIFSELFAPAAHKGLRRTPSKRRRKSSPGVQRT
jgi:hypothetical protein